MAIHYSPALFASQRAVAQLFVRGSQDTRIPFIMILGWDVQG